MRRDKWESLKTGMFVVGRSGIKRKILRWSPRSLTIVLKKIRHIGKRSEMTVYCVCDKNFFEIHKGKKRKPLAFSMISDIIEKGRNEAKKLIKKQMKGQKIQWTKAKIKFVIANWSKFSNRDLGKKIGVSEIAISTLAAELKKGGIPLAKKMVFSKFDLPDLIKEIAAENSGHIYKMSQKMSQAPKPVRVVVKEKKGFFSK